MKNIIITLLLAFTLSFTISACGRETTPVGDTGDSAKITSAQSTQETDVKDAADDDAIPTFIDSGHWPKDIVHPDMPEYKAGKLKGWSKWDSSDDYSIFILIDDTNKSDLEKYINDLKAVGFEETNSDTFHKGIYNVGFQFNGDKLLQISSKKEKTLEWPKALLVGVPELKKGAITGVIEPNADIPGYVQLYIINLTKEDLSVWLTDLETAGFKVEGENASKDNVELNGKNYKSMSVQFQENGSKEWMIDFNYSE